MRRGLVEQFRRVLTSRIAFGFSILLCTFIFFQLIEVVTRSTSTGKDIASLQAQVDTLQTEQKRLEQLRSFLQTDFFAEQEARSKFGLVKQGERALILKDSSEQDKNPQGVQEGGQQGGSSHSSSPPVRAPDEKNYHLWWRFFFGTE